jgi:hypothetical protein
MCSHGSILSDNLWGYRVSSQRHSTADDRGTQIHCLFLGLYQKTTQHWLNALESTDAPLFAHLVIRRFFELYETGVTRKITDPRSTTAEPWRKYHWLAGKLTMRSPISTHLALLAFGVRAHVRHDLSFAISRAADDYKDITGMPVNYDRERPNIIGPISANAFFTASLDYVDLHRSQRRGWRWLVLTAYSTALRRLRWIWVGTLEGWRRRAWSDALERTRIKQGSRPTDMQFVSK